MALRFVAVVVCLFSLSLLLTALPAKAGGPPVYAPPACGPAPVSCAPPPSGSSGPGFLGGGCLAICTNICGAIIGCPAAVMSWLLAPAPAPVGLPWGKAPSACAPPMCAPPVCAPAPITKCKPVYQPVCAPPVPQWGPARYPGAPGPMGPRGPFGW
jgi:hypothetical protein